MSRFSTSRELQFGCIGVLMLVACQAQAAVNLEFRPASQTVTNNTVVEVELYAVSDNAGNQTVGRLQAVFTWDPTVLRLSGILDNGPYDWLSLGFPNSAVNAPLTSGIPANDGGAAVVALSQFDPNPFADATPAGLLVATLQFTAIDTETDSPVALTANIGSDITVVYDIPAGETQMDVTGTLGAPVTVTVICNVNGDCDDANDCTNDTCGGQVCSHTPVSAGTSCGDITDTACDNPDTCDGAGTCQPNYETAGAACGSILDNDCTDPDTCDGAGECQANHEAAGTACGSPVDNECDNPDTCNASGTCQPNFEAQGTACGSPNKDQCDDPDSCNGSGTCDQNFMPAGTSCGDPADTACTDPDTCNSGGVCEENNFSGCLPPTPFCVDDGKGAPLCVECTFGNNAPCDDNNPCTADFCDLANVCRNAPDPKNGMDCSDSLFCNGAETCNDGACVALEAPCDDENPCTDDSCDEMNDTCANINDDTNDPDDGLFCNGVDTCVGGMIVVGDPPTCDDMNPCTDDSCDDVMGCVQTNNTAECEDGDPCTIDDVCGNGVCQPGPRPTGNGRVDLNFLPNTQTVEAGTTFTVELYAINNAGPADEMFAIDVVLNWDPALVELQGVINDGPYTWLLSFLPPEQELNMTYDDGNAFYAALSQLGEPALSQPAPGLKVTTFEFLALQDVSTTGTDIIIADCKGSDGTVTRVDGGTAGQLQGNLGDGTVAIVECFIDDTCADGIFCNGEEICDNNVCVSGGFVCDDENICTDDVCNEGFQTCNYIPLTGDFDQDGIYCNGVDQCIDGVFVQGTPIDCNDSNQCTNDSCNEVTDECDNIPNTNSCNDFDKCTDNDACSGGMCTGDPIPFCIPCTFDSDCEDNIECTINDCDDVLGVCRFIPDNGACMDDGVFCNGPEICLGLDGDPVTGCESAGEPCDDCTEEFGCACDTPVVNAVSSRYIEIIPPAGGNAIALVVTSCGGSNPQYVGAWNAQNDLLPIDLTLDGPIDGGAAKLVDDPADALWLTPAEWGDVVWVTGVFVAPNTTFMVQADCGSPGSPSLTAAASVTTWKFGDIDGNGTANLADALAGVQAFQNLFVEGNTKIRADIAPCNPNSVHNLDDVLQAILGFQQQDYAQVCPESVCP